MGGDKPCRRFRVLMFPPAFGEHIFLLRSQDWKLPDFRKIAIERYVRPERRNRREALNGSHILKSPWRSQAAFVRSEEHTSELQSLMRISYAVFCLKKKKETNIIVLDTTHMSTNIKNCTNDLQILPK